MLRRSSDHRNLCCGWRIVVLPIFPWDFPSCYDSAMSNLVPLFVHFLATLARSEEHTSELQSRLHLVCRLLLEKKKNKYHSITLSPIRGTHCSPPLIQATVVVR